MAAPTGNLNALKNGSRLTHRLILGELPKPLERVKRRARQYRRDLEASCVEVHGEIGIVHAHHIDAAAGHETHGSICRWLLCNRMDKMTAADIVNQEAETATADEHDAINEPLLESRPRSRGRI